jgi:hypothetical protein
VHQRIGWVLQTQLSDAAQDKQQKYLSNSCSTINAMLRASCRS